MGVEGERGEEGGRGERERERERESRGVEWGEGVKGEESGEIWE